MRLRRDLVLVKLAPARQAKRVSLITSDLDTFLSREGIEEFQRLLKRPDATSPMGRVVQVGDKTLDVWPGDIVILDADAEVQDCEFPDARGLPWPHVIVPEDKIAAVLERTV